MTSLSAKLSQHRAIIFVSFLLVLMVAAGLIFATAKQPVEPMPQTPDLAEVIRSRDLALLSGTLDDQVVMVQSGDACCQLVRDKEATIELLASKLTDHAGEFTTGDTTNIDTTYIFNPADFADFRVLFYEDGDSWIAYKVGETGLVEVIMPHFVTPDPSLDIIPATNSDADSFPSSDQTIITYLVVGGKEAGKERTASIGIATNFIDSGFEQTYVIKTPIPHTRCISRIYQVMPEGEVLLEERELEAYNGHIDSNFSLRSLGITEIRTACGENGDQKAAPIAINLTASQLSSCDTSIFRIDMGKHTYEEATKLIVGTWEGCQRDGTKNTGFAVQIALQQDGHYSAKNIEQRFNPRTAYVRPPLSLNKDADLDNIKYELLDVLGNGRISAQLERFPGNKVRMTETNSLFFNQQGDKMYFETNDGSILELRKV